DEGRSCQAMAGVVAGWALPPPRDPLTRELPRPLPCNNPVLDGGCGIGTWAQYFGRGRRVLGVDFALGALRTLRDAAPAVGICGGRVDALPIADRAVRVYYSGGVIEHFEEGPSGALAEAYRVLRPGGLLLLVVPELSPLREALCPGQQRLMRDGAEPVVGLRRMKAPCVDRSPWPQLRFFQYLYSPRELRRMVRDVGFDVLWDRAYGVQWALMELSPVQWLSARLRGRILERPADYYDRVPMAPWAQEPLIPAALPAPAQRFLRRLLTLEDDRVPFFGPALRLGQA